ncbi:restriction endonuclease [Verrucomicrobiaceae bacterium 227]
MKVSPSWKVFEEEVARLFSLRGYKVTSNIQIEGRQTDVFLQSKDEAVGQILVECKHRENPGDSVGVEEVEAFVHRVANLRNDGKVNSGYLVTNANFTAPASAVAGRERTKNFVFLRNIEEISRSLIDFRPYLARQISALAKDPTLGDEHEELNANIGFRSEEISLDKAFSDFLSKESVSSTQILTAEFGMGKTTSLKRLHLTLARKHLEEPQKNPIPCYIPLKNYYDTGSSRSLINQFICDEVGHFGSSWLSFAEMLSGGFLVLILDGFDEMTAQSNSDTRFSCFSKLAELCTKEGRVIISGRPNYFPEESEMRDAAGLLLGGSARDSLRAILKNPENQASDESITVSFARIQPLNEFQIRSFILKRLQSESTAPRTTGLKEGANEVFSKIEKIYNLRELAERPILLEMICASLGELESGKVSNVSDLYDLYTDAWLKVESLKGDVRSYLTSNQRLLFSIGLACSMLKDEFKKGSIHYRRLRGEVADFFGESEIEKIDYLSSDVQTCGFISRDREGRYSFAHRSFFEYFVARAIAINAGLRKQDLRESISENLDHLWIWVEEEVKTAVELEEKETGIFSFLECMLSLPLNSIFWDRLRNILVKIDTFLRANIGMLEQKKVIEEIWNVVAEIDVEPIMIEKIHYWEGRFSELKKYLITLGDGLRKPAASSLSDELNKILHFE